MSPTKAWRPLCLVFLLQCAIASATATEVLAGISSSITCSAACQATRDCVHYYFEAANGTCSLGETVELAPATQIQHDGERLHVRIEDHVPLKVTSGYLELGRLYFFKRMEKHEHRYCASRAFGQSRYETIL